MPIAIDCNYPGGNVLLRGIDGDRIVVAQDIRDTTEWWFWWNFRVRGAAGRTLRVEFDDEVGPVGPNGPAMSTNRRSWRWAWQADGRGPCSAHDVHGFTIAVPPDADTVYFAFSFPYQLEDWERFVAPHRACPDVRADVLTTTRAEREAPRVRIGDPEAADRNVLFTCRHHACECVASYVLEGAMAFILSSEADALRRTTAFTVVPLVDLDGVEAGDQGKLRAPRDHNADYGEGSVHPTVQAMKRLIDDLSHRRLAILLDFHCPWIRNAENEATFLVEPPEPYAAHARQFGEMLRRVNDSPIPYTGKRDVPSGTSWNVPKPGRVTSGGYARLKDAGALLTSLTLETSYSLSEGAVVTPEAARDLGRCVARAVELFLS